MNLPAPESHIVSFAYEAWGHTRPLIAFVARAVKTRPILVTLFTTDTFYERVKIELSRSFEQDEEVFKSRVRLLSLAQGNSFTAGPLDVAFSSAWHKLLNEEDVICTKTGERFPAVLQPNVLLMEGFSHHPIREVRASCGNRVKIYLWVPSMLTCFCRLSGPEILGGLGDTHRMALEEAQSTGKTYEEIATRIMFGGKGDIVRLPGMPPMFDYEAHPQSFPVLRQFGGARFMGMHEILYMADGIVSLTTTSYEREMVDAWRKWFEGISKQLFVVGPLRVSGTNAVTYEKKQSAAPAELDAFLGNALQTFGERSVLYISFGSTFWPVEKPDILWAFLDVVMELNTPFVMSHASAMASIPDSVREAVKTYGKGLISAWIPQQLVLNHPATGWFVTHGGQNSVLESLSAGVPQIFWPFEADQPLNAINMTEKFKAAYELIEVRTGDGEKPSFRNGRKPAGTIDAVKAEARDVLTKAFGEDGARKRERFLRLQQEVLSEWEEGGASRRDFMAFLDSLRA
ncbi:UDP-Glycosyltransferase/glycogen phosphorylase [Cubamyces sp. BRFM 1775]|nr:UDP-Glycosyltransferase/glycogen phosphorylase [Cubamyces sp. BRFM 1775]